MSTRNIRVYRDILERDAAWAEQTREMARREGVLLLNLIGSPGSGKTALLEQTARILGADRRIAVLEGDVATTRDAERLDACGVMVSQLITDGACHLSAQLVHTAFRDLPLADLDIVFVENVGNLVCPAAFDIGENAKIAVLSLTEGEDKPVKYPRLFRDAAAAVLTKIDLEPHIPATRTQCLEALRQVHPDMPVFQVSSVTSEGVAEWCDWLENLGTE